MPVVEMRERMGNDEFVLWSRYFARQAQQQELAERLAS